MPSEVSDELPEQRVLEASMLLPAGGAVTGWGSLRLLRAGFFDGLERDGLSRRPVLLVAGERQSRRDRDGVVWSQDRLPPEEVRHTHGIPHTIAERAVFDEMRTARDDREAAVVLDMAAAAERTSIRRVRTYVDAHPGWRGAPLARAGLELADEHSRSPNETRMRLIWTEDAGLPRPLVNQPVWELDGSLLGIADLFDPVAGVVGEFDGADHRWASRHARDVAREDRFRRAGLEYFKVTGPDIDDRLLVVERMTSTRARAQGTGVVRRRWTLDPPPGRQPGPCLDDLLDHRDVMREIYEQQERADLSELG